MVVCVCACLLLGKTNARAPLDPPNPPNPLSAAWHRLQTFTAADKAGRARPLLADPAARAALADAVRVVAAAPHPPANWHPDTRPRRLLLAVLASNEALAARALRDYCDAFGVPYSPPRPRVQAGGVFVRLNAATDAPPPVPTAAPYSGSDRGVLITLGDVQLGHLPLGLLDEGREKEAPPLE